MGQSQTSLPAGRDTETDKRRLAEDSVANVSQQRHAATLIHEKTNPKSGDHSAEAFFSMVRVRKKSSKRQGTRLRERIKTKVSAAQHKAKKQAKKDVTWKSKKPKDPGVPSLFPFKDQVLEEMKQAKLQREVDRKLKKEQRILPPPPPSGSIEQLAASIATRDEEPAFEAEEETTSNVSSSLRTHAKSLRAVLSRADVIIEVLDARDPQGTRSRAMEKEFLAMQGDKHLILVLNKIDLVPRENVESWLTRLRRSFPTLPFKSSTQQQRRNLGSSSSAANASISASTSTQPILSLLKNYARSPAGGKGKSTITIGVVGMPNVGKSSLINSLKRSRACGVAPTPGYTKEVQEVSLDAGLKILDCPGVVFEGGDQGPESALRNALRVEQLDDPIAPVEVLIKRCKPAQLMMLYNIPTFVGVQDFLICVARSRGRLRKGGIPDLAGTAKSVLRDWNAGRIPYYTAAPTTVPTKSKSTATAASTGDAIVSSFAPAFDLDALFGEADAAALAESGNSSNGIVRMDFDEPHDPKAKLMGESETEVSEVEENVVTTLSGSRKRPLEEGKKQVRFAADFAPNNPEAPAVPLAKKAKLQAKKAKKDARRAEAAKANEMAVDEDSFVTAPMSPSPPAESLQGLDVETGKLTVDDDDTPYDFAAYFARSATQSEGEWQSEDDEEL